MTTHHFLPGNQDDLNRTLNDLSHKMQEEETKARAITLSVPYIDLYNFPIDFNVLGIFEENLARNLNAVVFYKDQNDLRIGTTDVLNSALKAKIQELSVKNKVSLYLISSLSLNRTMALYSKVLKPKHSQDEILKITEKKDYKQLIKNIEKDEKYNASDLMEMIFGSAMQMSVSDIHLEPEDHMLKVRFRLDGVLHDVGKISKNLEKSLLMRVKILSKLRLNISSEPQDGRLTFYFFNNPVDVRVSILPTANGEEVVMRILGSGVGQLKIHELGLRKIHEDLLKKVMNKPNGMVITTGPTGSGKTTTLYACLNELNSPGVKIITLEDPVEYKLEGIVQTPIDHNHNFDFAKGLRAILRQDPDVVMVGEIRDGETAETAMQSALTGHLVFSTLHTNDSAGAIPRLLNLGVKPFVVAPALSLVIAQRLVRKLCIYCKKPAVLAPGVMDKVMQILKSIPKISGIHLPKEIQFFHSQGCEKCEQLGYKGRIGIYEFLENTEAIQKLIFEQASSLTFKKQSQEQGMISMSQDGFLKALEGLTDVEEVFRVAGE